MVNEKGLSSASPSVINYPLQVTQPSAVEEHNHLGALKYELNQSHGQPNVVNAISNDGNVLFVFTKITKERKFAKGRCHRYC